MYVSCVAPKSMLESVDLTNLAPHETYQLHEYEAYQFATYPTRPYRRIIDSDDSDDSNTAIYWLTSMIRSEVRRIMYTRKAKKRLKAIQKSA